MTSQDGGMQGLFPDGLEDVAEHIGSQEGSPSADLFASLGEPNEEERALLDAIQRVDLSDTHSNKWNEVRQLLCTLLYETDQDWRARVGASGMKDRASLNQLTNRLRQNGVQDVDTTIFVVGDAVLIPIVARALARVVENGDTRLRQACIVLEDREHDGGRIVRIIERES